jgi:hypothetical protein
VVKTTTLTSRLLVALAVLASSPVLGQRVQFPSAIPTNTAQANTYGAAPNTYSGTSPYGTAPGTPTYGTTPAPSYGTTPAPGYGSTPPAGGVPGTAPGYGTAPPPTYGTAPPPTYGTAPGPAATLQGDIQPAPTWDPYATPGTAAPPLLPQDPTMPVFPGPPPTTITTWKRFLQEMRLDYVYIPGTASNEFGVNDADITAEFAIPFLRNPQTPLLVTPGFTFHWWNGPVSRWWFPPAVPDDWLGPELPPRAYSAYLNTAWNPQLSRVLSGELAFRVGVYSDFSQVINESIRYQGYGYGLVALSPSFQLKAGVIYLDRNKIKLLPAGGVIWTPNDDVRFEILFPNPKLAIRLPGYSTTEWWLYARGEYGGGAWTVETSYRMWDGAAWPLYTPLVEFDYNDMRAAVGVDFQTVRGLQGLFEVGVAFEREIYYPRLLDPLGPPFSFTFRPDPTVFVRGGLAY